MKSIIALTPFLLSGLARAEASKVGNEHVREGLTEAAKEPIAPLVDYTAQKEYLGAVEKLSDLAKAFRAEDINEKSDHPAAKVIVALDDYLVNATDKSRINAFVEAIEVAHKAAGIKVKELYTQVAELFFRLPATDNAINNLTGKDKDTLARLRELRAKYEAPLRKAVVEAKAEYDSIKAKYRGQEVEEEHQDPLDKNKKIKVMVDAVDHYRKAFKVKAAFPPAELAADVLEIVYLVISSFPKAKGMNAFKADVLSKAAMAARIALGVAGKKFREPLGKSLTAAVAGANDASATYFPLYSSPLFWFLVVLVVLLVAGVATTVVVFSA